MLKTITFQLLALVYNAPKQASNPSNSKTPNIRNPQITQLRTLEMANKERLGIDSNKARK